MKIFNWMNRKFSSKDGRSLKKDEFVIAKEMAKEPLIEKVGLVDLIDVDWKDNLLAIGTLGFDQFYKFIPDEDYFNHLFPDQNEEESENDDDEYPAEEEFFENNDEVDDENATTFLLPLADLKNGLVKGDRIKNVNGNTLEPLSSRNENIVDCGFKEEEKDCTKKKVTLAELFSAESVEDMKGHNEKDKDKAISMTISGYSKHKLSSTKKFIPRVARVDVRLAHKLNQMMTRMLKRKIHPDPVSQGKHQKDKNNKTSIFGPQRCVKHSINETVSLLRTRDVEI